MNIASSHSVNILVLIILLQIKQKSRSLEIVITKSVVQNQFRKSPPVMTDWSQEYSQISMCILAQTSNSYIEV